MGIRRSGTARVSSPPDVGSATPATFDGWVLPGWLAEQLDPKSPAAVSSSLQLANVTKRSWTSIGVISGLGTATVDPAGLVTPRRGGWSLDWWVGADDRWHFPSRDAAVRQRLVDGTPVVETAMRIPGGDAVHRAYAVPGPPEAVVVEIENRSPVPFALALAIRPFNPEGVAAVETITIDDRTVGVDGRAALLLPKRPAAMAGGTAAGGDCATIVTAGRAGPDLPADLRCPAGLAQAAFIFPLPHTAVIRVALPVDRSDGKRRRRATRGQPGLARTEPHELPPAAAVARGWEAHSRRGMRLALPSGGLAEAVEANRGFLLLFRPDLMPGRSGFDESVAVLTALDRYGFHREVAEVLQRVAAQQHRDGRYFPRTDEPAGTAAALSVMAEHRRLAGPDGSVDDDSVERAARWIRANRRAAARAADLIPQGLGSGPADHLGPVRPAGPVEMLHLAASELEAGDREALDRLQQVLGAATGTYTWPADPMALSGVGTSASGHDLSAGTQLLLLVRDLLVREVTGGLVLLSMVPDAWRGQPLEVHDAPTHLGRMSFALRWHGPRPALLWQLVPHDDAAEVRITIPGVDATWSSNEVRGEALLASLEDEADGR